MFLQYSNVWLLKTIEKSIYWDFASYRLSTKIYPRLFEFADVTFFCFFIDLIEIVFKHLAFYF